jgi:predicted TIM-barrel fold metal-dependent hydrolase
VKRWPSEYIHDHIVFGTQPIDTPEDPRALAEVLTQIDWLGDVLCFASDYPHGIAYDDARFVARHLPESWHRNVFCDNACAAYGLPRPPVEAPEPETAGAR